LATTQLNGQIVSTNVTQVVTGTPINDTINALGQLIESSLSGIEGNDTIIYAGNAEDTLFDGGDETDYLSFEGNGTLTTNLVDVTAVGGNGDDSVIFGWRNYATGSPGGSKVAITDSLVRGDGGNDYIYFGEDTSVTNTLVNGNKGRDSIFIDEASLDQTTIQGGQGNDLVVSNGFFDEPQTIDGSIINGNLGNDMISFDYVEIAGSNVFGGQSSDTILALETSLLDSKVSGDVGADTIYFGFFGEDSTVESYAENSTVSGGADADVIAFGAVPFLPPIGLQSSFFSSGELVTTLIDGGTGNDAIWIGEDIRIADSTVLGGDNVDYIYVGGFAGEDGFGGLKGSIVDGGAGSDFIDIGNIEVGTASSIFGGDGSDDINSDEDDTTGAYWSGDAGNDTIDATDGKDTILGGDGNDIIDGEGKGDLITGGAGNDIFQYWSVDDSNVDGVDNAALGSKIDTITDFSAVDDDFNLTYSVVRLEYVSSNFSTTWQNTVDAAFASTSNSMDDNEAAILTINSGINEGVYLLFLRGGDAAETSSGWCATDTELDSNDGIIKLDNVSGFITQSNFLPGFF